MLSLRTSCLTTSAVNSRRPRQRVLALRAPASTRRGDIRLRSTALTLCLGILFLLAACGGEAPRQVLRGSTMGTTWSVVYAPNGSLSAEALQTLLEDELGTINNALSTYMPDSEISQLNANDSAKPIVLSEPFAQVLGTALRIGALTEGAYDVTVGPLVELWGFGRADFRGAVPPRAAIERALGQVGAHRLSWEPAARQILQPVGYSLDLSSIAKGYAVDRLSALLLQQGLRHTLVEIGGELRARGGRPEGGPWRLAIESPDPAGQRFLEALTLGDGAVATSGDYRNFFELDGQRYSHLVDPRSGYPVTHDLVSVTVVHDSCMSADAWATALIVLGLERAMVLAEAQGLAAYLVSRSSDGLEVHYTQRFSGYRQSASTAKES